MLAHQAAAAVGVGTCWPCETAAMLPSARRPWREKRGGGISWRLTAYSLSNNNKLTVNKVTKQHLIYHRSRLQTVLGEMVYRPSLAHDDVNGFVDSLA